MKDFFFNCLVLCFISVVIGWILLSFLPDRLFSSELVYDNKPFLQLLPHACS